MFGAAEALTQEQLEAFAASSFPSIRATLVGAEWTWLRRWLGDSPMSVPVWAGQPTRLSGVYWRSFLGLAATRGRPISRVLLQVQMY